MKHLTHEKINKQAWDRCILADPSQLPYALSWFLDTASPGWEALVWGDYDVVMPLPVKRKWGMPYLIQPAGCQQLGLFGSSLNQTHLDEAIRWLKKHYLFIHMYFNFRNLHPRFKARKNIVLSLADTYENIRANYHTNLKRNLKKAQGQPVFMTENFIWETLLTHFRQGHHFRKTPSGWIATIEMLGYEAFKRQQGKTFGLFAEDGTFLAGAFLLFMPGRIIFWFSATSSKGKSVAAMHVLIDALLKKFANSSLIFDFEGSENPTLARFYLSFGSKEQPYYCWKKIL